MKRGELWWADLGPHRPQEQTGRRPVIVWQSDALTPGGSVPPRDVVDHVREGSEPPRRPKRAGAPGSGTGRVATISRRCPPTGPASHGRLRGSQRLPNMITHARMSAAPVAAIHRIPAPAASAIVGLYR